MIFRVRISCAWVFALIACLILAAASSSFAQAGVAKSTKKVTVTLVRWPYT